MPDWLATILVGLVPAIVLFAVTWGAFSTRLRRLEADVMKCVQREVYAAEQKAMDDRLSRIEASTTRILDLLTRARARPGEGTDPGFPG